MGLRARKNYNKTRRANGNEPTPGAFAGVKRWARHLRRIPVRPIKIKNPERYLSAHARRMAALVKVIGAHR
jgi:hypothetical protein